MNSRTLSSLLLAVAGTVLVVRLLLLQGAGTVISIDGGSMAESLPGDHVEVTCAKCARTWRADLPQWQTVTHLICPECGQSADDITHVQVHPPTQVVIDRAAFLLAHPQRFD